MFLLVYREKKANLSEEVGSVNVKVNRVNVITYGDEESERVHRGREALW